MKLFAHQVKGLEIARNHPRYAFFHSCGVGKTIMMLAICAERPMPTLVLAPKTILDSAWRKDAENFPGLKPGIIRSAAGVGIGDGLQITNYDRFRLSLPAFLAAGFKRLIVDESSKIKNHESAITKSVWAFSDRCDEVYLGSGTPAPNNVTEYYGQLRALGKNVAGVSYWSFASRYATPIRERVRVRGGATKELVTGFRQSPEQAERLGALLKQHAWSLRKEDCLDLPAKSDVVVSVTLSDEERRAYIAAQKELRLAVDSDANKINAEARLIKLRQITGGMVRDTAGVVHKLGTAKLDALAESLDSIGLEPVVIWAEFTPEIDAVRDLCKERGESVEVIDGRTSSRAGQIADEFQAGKIQRLVCHPQAAGHGITLTAASYAIYFSLSFSYEQYEQSRDRIHRAGQTRPCTYIHLIAADTVDEGELRVVRKKGSVAEEFRKQCGRG